MRGTHVSSHQFFINWAMWFNNKANRGFLRESQVKNRVCSRLARALPGGTGMRYTLG
jgi:hypothetical protein